MSKEIRETPEHDCEFFLTTDVCVHSCECEHVTVSDASTSIEYVPLKKYQVLQNRLSSLESVLGEIISCQYDPEKSLANLNGAIRNAKELIGKKCLALDSDSKR
jgi:hypothetical protein